MRNFERQWHALENKKDETEPDTPKISKELPIIKWVEAFKDHLHRCIGASYNPLGYIIREHATPPAIAPVLAVNQPYSTEHASSEGELIARASHNDTLCRDDNAMM